MSGIDEPFDPYRKWLGIPPQHQPPNHYRLLGIEVFEPDPDVIAHAADQRMAYVKTLATGKHSAVSQQILNEMAAARVCLLSAAEKARYDAALRQQLSAPPVAASVAAPASAPPRHAPAAAPARPRHAAPPPAAAAVIEEPDERRPVALYVLGAMAIVLLTAIGVFLSRPLWSGKAVANLPGAAGDDNRGGESTSAVPKPAEPNEVASKKSEPLAEVPVAPPVEKPVEPPKDPPPEKPVPPEKPAPELPPQPPVEPPAPMPETPAPPIEPAPAAKLPAPRDDAAKAVEREIRGLYKEKLQAATTAEAKLALSGEFARLAGDAKETPENRFTLLRLAAGLAAEAEDLDAALSLVDRMGEQFEFRAWDLKWSLLPRAEAGKVASPAINTKILQAARRLADEAVAAGEVEAAVQSLEKAALPAARRLRDKRLTTQIEESSRRLGHLRARQATVKKAEEQLASTPDDPAANATAGAWDCFVCGNWSRGLPRLVKADDAALAALAKQDLAGGGSGASQRAALGDAWWKLGDDRKGIEQTRLQARAAHWYKLALPELQGLERAKLEKRLDELGLQLVPYALKFDGKTAYVGIKGFAYNGSYPLTLEAFVLPSSGRQDAGGEGMQTVLGNQCGYQGGISLMCSHGRFSFSTATGLNSPNTDAVYQQRFERRNSSDWVHAAGVFDGKEVRMFLNGQLDATRPITGIHRPAALPFLVGTGYYQSDSRQPPSPRYYFNGLIRGVRISNSARYVKDFTPPAELTADANTRVLLTFAEGKGTQTKDSSGNNFHGEIIGAEWVKLGADLQPAGN